MRGMNIVIPPNLQEQMLKLLHEAHPGSDSNEGSRQILCVVARNNKRH